MNIQIENKHRYKTAKEIKYDAELIRWKQHMCGGISVIDRQCINKHGTVIQDEDAIGCKGCPYEIVED